MHVDFALKCLQIVFLILVTGINWCITGSLENPRFTSASEVLRYTHIIVPLSLSLWNRQFQLNKEQESKLCLIKLQHSHSINQNEVSILFYLLSFIHVIYMPHLKIACYTLLENVEQST